MERLFGSDSVSVYDNVPLDMEKHSKFLVRILVLMGQLHEVLEGHFLQCDGKCDLPHICVD